MARLEEDTRVDGENSSTYKHWYNYKILHSERQGEDEDRT